MLFSAFGERLLVFSLKMKECNSFNPVACFRLKLALTNSGLPQGYRENISQQLRPGSFKFILAKSGRLHDPLPQALHHRYPPQDLPCLSPYHSTCFFTSLLDSPLPSSLHFSSLLTSGARPVLLFSLSAHVVTISIKVNIHNPRLVLQPVPPAIGDPLVLVGGAVVEEGEQAEAVELDSLGRFIKS